MRVDIRTNGRVSDLTSLPATDGRFMDDLLARPAAGQVVTLIPEQALVTTDEAADLLLASGAFGSQLIDRGELPASVNGAGRLVRFADVMAFKRRNDAEREAALVELAQLSQEMGLY